VIELSEQYGYKNPKSVDLTERERIVLGNKSYYKSIQRGDNRALCYSIIYNASEQNSFLFETAYFVGIDWIVENELSIYVKPKLDDDFSEVNYVKMLFDILKEPENYNHLEELCEINFEKPLINIDQRHDLLTPLLLIQYLNILKKIANKGLKKSYYTVTKNLNAKVKGKILVNETIKKNHSKSRFLYSYCHYSEFGVNNAENRALKKAFEFTVAVIQNLKGIETEGLQSMIKYIQPTFQNVESEFNIEALKAIKPNQLFKEYEQALKFAKLILKRYGYNISKANSAVVSSPPFWLDMSKLFELYVYSKLRERFPHHNEVSYHKTFNFLEPDFIIKSVDGEIKMVVDAKYKPQYHDGKINTDDIRQISGYARLEKVYKFLEYEEKKVVDCLVIYSSQLSGRKDFKGNNFNFEKEKEYHQFYKIGIELPIK
jgi:5-methylcytosine-specific restriction enzyme subunit McrC